MFKSVGSDSHFFSLVSLVAPVLVDTADLVTLAVTSDLVPLLDFGGGLGEEMQTENNVTQWTFKVVQQDGVKYIYIIDWTEGYII